MCTGLEVKSQEGYDVFEKRQWIGTKLSTNKSNVRYVKRLIERVGSDNSAYACINEGSNISFVFIRH